MASTMKRDKDQNPTPRPSSLAEASTPSTTDGLLEKALTPSFDERRQQRCWTSRKMTMVIHVLVFCVYVGTLVALGLEIGRLQKKLDRTLLYSPANEAIEWEISEWHAGDGLSEPFVGEPRPELEAAWKGLLGNMNIRLSRDDVARVGRFEDAVELPDGSGYAGTLNVYHELHCVRWLHKHLYQEHYFPGLDDQQRRKNKVHSEHCISTLRKFATCHGDVGLVTYGWRANSSKPSATGTGHGCINWERLSRWSAERAFDMFQPGLLVHPLLGPAYPNGVEEWHAFHHP